MAEKLTPQQEQAVNDRGGRLLVSAAAGSGKTKVLVDRLLKYLMDPVAPASLDEFLIITYTKAAASELRGKIAAKLTERIAENPENRHLQQQVQRLYLTKISTVHSFCADLLRSYAYRLDLSADFRVADENECRELRQIVMEQLLDDVYENAMENRDFRSFVDHHGLGRNDALVPEIILKTYDSARCHLDPQGWLDRCVTDSDPGSIRDAGETPWGRFLMEDLFSWMDLQIGALNQCVLEMNGAEGFEKPETVITNTLNQLKALRAADSWDGIYTGKDIDFGRLLFSKKCSDLDLADRVKAIRNGCKKGYEKKIRNFADSSEQIRDDLLNSASGVRGLVWLVREFGKRYDQIKKSRRVLDFGDLEHLTLDLLLGKHRSGPTVAAAEIGQQFREILVDEYQDSNAVQDAIFSALTQKKQNLFMVGDVKQSIYQFRLADPGIFLNKYANFVPAEQAEPGQGRKVLLSANFRSGGAVLSAVNQVFRACMSPRVGGLTYGTEEALREGIPHIPLGEPEVELHVVDIREDTYPEEAEFLASRIKELLDGTHMVRQADGLRPIVADDVVILLRSPGSVGTYYQQALASRGIRCAFGGGADLLQTPEVQSLRSLLQTISNPRQDIPLLATMTSPVFGFTADELAMIRADNRKALFYDAVADSKLEKCRHFVEMINFLREYATMHTLTELVETVLNRTAMDLVYGAMDNGAVRVNHLQSFFQLASEYEQVSRRDLNQFLEHLDALEEKGVPIAGEQESGCVTIMSIHKSKGLEFPVVILAGLSREFNRESIRSQVLCDQELGLGLSCIDSKNRVRYPSIAKKAIAVKTVADSVSEELRVLYVAMTRARDRLIMSYASRNPQGELQDIALRMDMGDRELLTADVVCPGEWVLYAALMRMEAGALHALGGRPANLEISDHPWKICISSAETSHEVSTAEAQSVLSLPYRAEEMLQYALENPYSHRAATVAPSKQTATGHKGRERDQEAAEHTAKSTVNWKGWRKPGFRDGNISGKQKGTAIHQVMQFIDYQKCGTLESVKEELCRLLQQQFITQDQADATDPDKILRLFRSELGSKLMSGNILREFKFSLLDDAQKYGEDLAGEQVLLQGVVDCALLEPDGITIVDYKTDYVTEETELSLVNRYRTQLSVYARAMERIFDQPVKGAYLYSFCLDKFIPIR